MRDRKSEGRTSSCKSQPVGEISLEMTKTSWLAETANRQGGLYMVGKAKAMLLKARSDAAQAAFHNKQKRFQTSKT